ncbi:unannotated protein [freshwater metagenome]|uniref:Unannotated protein n=1 Tax=freshwater metagenome TaxID=449393 RepID=A0A6J6B196_9ZZZZ
MVPAEEFAAGAGVAGATGVAGAGGGVAGATTATGA